MLACKHQKSAFGSPMCFHLQTGREPWTKHVKWYTGSGLNAELLCVPCVERRKQGLVVEVANVCEDCYSFITTEVSYQVSTAGAPELKIRPEPFNSTLKQ